MRALGGGMRGVLLAIAALAVGLALFGCGDSGEDGAEQLAKQQELQAAREEGARDARQGARITQLERKLRNATRQADEGPAGAVVDPPPSSGGAEEPLSGLWKGEAVIEYDSGESDPFNQTIKIDSLVPGAVSGYSEARQGSTTCHGPLTYEGLSDGWYRFSASERNVAECIDYSVVEVTPDGSGNLAYREATDVSISTGTLQPVQ